MGQILYLMSYMINTRCCFKQPFFFSCFPAVYSFLLLLLSSSCSSFLCLLGSSSSSWIPIEWICRWLCHSKDLISCMSSCLTISSSSQRRNCPDQYLQNLQSKHQLLVPCWKPWLHWDTTSQLAMKQLVATLTISHICTDLNIQV